MQRVKKTLNAVRNSDEIFLKQLRIKVKRQMFLIEHNLLCVWLQLCVVCIRDGVCV